MDLALGLAWTTHYPRLFPSFLFNLDAAYRGPALFAGTLASSGVRVAAISCDEFLDCTWLDGLLTGPAAPDVLYLAGHGSVPGGIYEAILDHDTWTPEAKAVRCSLIVLETCSLIDTRRGPLSAWSMELGGPYLRVILGFDGVATMSRGTTIRARAFAELLAAGTPIVEAWRRAVAQTSLPSQRDRPVALITGNDEADAVDFAANGTLFDLPRPLTSQDPFLIFRT